MEFLSRSQDDICLDASAKASNCSSYFEDPPTLPPKPSYVALKPILFHVRKLPRSVHSAGGSTPKRYRDTQACGVGQVAYGTRSSFPWLLCMVKACNVTVVEMVCVSKRATWGSPRETWVPRDAVHKGCLLQLLSWSLRYTSLSLSTSTDH